MPVKGDGHRACEAGSDVSICRTAALDFTNLKLERYVSTTAPIPGR